MHQALCRLKSVSPYSQGRFHDIPRNPKESADDHEHRTWRARLHTTKRGHVFIPGMSFKLCLAEAAKFLGEQIPGKGKSTYTKHFEAGVMVLDDCELPDVAEEVDGEWLFVPADGRRGSGKRVKKCFPLIPAWEVAVTFYITDDTITQDVFTYHLKQAGQFIGIGRWRPRNNGLYGRFTVESVEWSEVAL